MAPTDEKNSPPGLSTKKPSSLKKDSDSTAEKKSAEHDAVGTTPATKTEEATPVAFTELFRSVLRPLYSSGVFMFNSVVQ